MEMLVICDEIIRDVRYAMGGIEISERTLAREAIHAVTPGAGFLASDHTLENWKTYQWRPQVIDRLRYDAWQTRGSTDMADSRPASVPARSWRRTQVEPLSGDGGVWCDSRRVHANLAEVAYSGYQEPAVDRQDHLLDGARGPHVSAQQGGAARHLAVLLLRRQDRRAGPERRGQEHAACASWRASTRVTRARRCCPRASPSACSSRSRRSTASKTVRQVVEEAVQPIMDLLARFDEVNNRFAEELTPEEMDTAARRAGPAAGRTGPGRRLGLDSRLELAMDALRCPPADTPIAVLSGGELRRVALCRLLLTEPDILLLDEPTNHLDAESVAWLERHLQQYKGTVIAVTHDRYFLDNVAGWILELDRGYGIPWKGNYSSWLEQKQARLATGGDRREEAPAGLGARAGVDPPIAARAGRPRARPASAPTTTC